MSKFIKENFSYHGGYLIYYTDGIYQGDRKFVARFKYGQINANTWINFMIKNFSVEEYFDRLDNDESPLRVMQSKGFMTPADKRLCKEYNQPLTRAGFDKAFALYMQRAA